MATPCDLVFIDSDMSVRPVLRHLFVRWPNEICERMSQEAWGHADMDMEVQAATNNIKHLSCMAVMEETQWSCMAAAETPRTDHFTSRRLAEEHQISCMAAAEAPQTDDFTSRRLVDAIVLQLEPIAAVQQEPALRKVLVLHEAGHLSKEEFLKEVRRIADRSAVRRAIVALATASENASLKELVCNQKLAARKDDAMDTKPLRSSAVAVATAPVSARGCRPVSRPSSPEQSRTWWL